MNYSNNELKMELIMNWRVWVSMIQKEMKWMKIIKVIQKEKIY